MAKVYITNKSGHDFSAAEVFGDFIFLSSGSINRYSVNRMHRQFIEALRNSEACDYLLPTALSTMNMIAACIFALKHGRLNLLLFKDGIYVERTLVFDDDELLYDQIAEAFESDAAKALLKG